MPRISYVNGQYVPHADAWVHVEDRGYQFADGVYEVIAVIDGVLIDKAAHIDRLGRSLDALAMNWPVARAALRLIIDQVVRRNRVRNGKVYLQVSRGVAPRDFAIPQDGVSSLVVTASALPPFDLEKAGQGIAVITVPDQRWARRDIKTINLLPASLAKQQALDAGVTEAWMVDPDGTVTEGTSCNAWIVTAPGVLVTRQLSSHILGGVTRASLIDLAKAQGVTVEERPFTVDEAKTAREAFNTSSTVMLKPVVRIDGAPVGNGDVGPLTTVLLNAYGEFLTRGGAPS